MPPSAPALGIAYAPRAHFCWRLLLWACACVSTAAATANPPAPVEPNLVIGDGLYGEVWRVEGRPDAALYGSRIAVGDVFLAIVGQRLGTGTPRFVDLYRRDVDIWTLDATLEPTPSEGFAEAVAIDGLRCAVLTPTGVNIYLRGEQGWISEASVTLPGLTPGAALAMRGNVVAVGRPLLNGAATAIGQVEIVTKGVGGWQFSASIANPTPVAGRRFGSAVAFDGESLIISAPRENGSASWSGAVYRYAPGAPAWTLETTILPQGLTPDARFGTALSTDGGRIAVGAPNDALLGAATGAVVLLTPTRGGYSQMVQRSSVSGAGREFGAAVALRGDRLVVGSPMGTPSSTRTGMAELFVEDASGGWAVERLLMPAPWKVQPLGVSTAVDAVRNIGAGCLVDPFDGTCIVSAPNSFVDGRPSAGFVYGLGEGRPDCNGNRTPDLVETIGSQSIALGPLPFDGDVSHSLVIPAEPAPTGPIRITTVARTNGGTGTVLVNGIEVGSLYQNRFTGCAATWGPNQVLVPLATYQSITGGGPGTVTITHGGSGSCAPLGDSYLRAEVRYPTSSDAGDLDGSLAPDACQDCDGDGTVDVVAIALGAVEDCDGNWVPDACEVLTDCNGNGVADACEIAAGEESDCNGDGTLDACQIAAGDLADCNGDGLPDLCDIIATDASSDDAELSASLSGVTNAIRLQGLRTTAETKTLFGVSVLWKAFSDQPMPPASTPVTIIVFADPNQNGTPDDAVPLTSTTVFLGTPGVQEFDHYAIPATVIGPEGTSFFIGAFVSVASSTLLGLDCEVKSGALLPYYGANLPDPPTSSIDPALLLPLPSSFPRSVWTLRGLGLEAFVCLVGDPADLDRDGSVGPSDLSILLGNWGSAGTGDLDGSGSVGSADLAILLGAWTI